ncbi:U5 small nuclear ribonucleoprotein 40kDa subunit (nucleomorph) [Chroomonas mesostigmatica CCMP1168]|uniref:U5 small nuclear ribonucleoprotein 40kDa subunit n=1 Tax=Chroomonas mesostigmatica CCMP1168 TaxID=1195612 RepID=J7GAH9_9CRYP|nr:U5 small nuclear ribonucleoprotein 40kDa subunit [Chroomonas mesostigmatica CCMP1168]|mmetsp:Transcript_25142/g.61800  ORF Transcript_25142/g.61800 Transcript_25142/m.61800 type:complete len:302 (+) Transcript_25142:2492-3397(+)
MVNIRMYLCDEELISCSFSCDGKVTACGGVTGNFFLTVNRFHSFKTKIFKIHEGPINRIFFDKKNFYTASSDKTCRIWNPETSQILRTLNLNNEKATYIDLINNLIITAGNRGTLKLWDQRIQCPIGNFFHGFPILNSNFLKSGHTFVSCGISPNLFLWDIRNYKKYCSVFSLVGHRTSIYSSSLSNYDFSLFSIDFNNLVCRWIFELSKNLAKCYFLKSEKIFPKALKPSFYKITCDSLGKIFAQGGLNGSVYFKNQKKGKIIQKIKSHSWGRVNDVKFHPSNRIFGSCGEDGFLNIKEF